MTLKILIVDDEELACMRLKSLLADCTAPAAEVVGVAANTNQALHYVLQHQPDLVLADIQMPGDDGLTLAKRLRSLAFSPALVFVTAHAEHALKAFDLAAADYLTKPVRLERLQIALQKVAHALPRNQSLQPDLKSMPSHDFFLIQDRGAALRLPLADVLYLKAELKYITVRTALRTYVQEGSLSDLERRYGNYFLRIHRNALVARSAVRALERCRHPVDGSFWALRLEQLTESLFVSRRQLAAVKVLLKERQTKPLVQQKIQQKTQSS